MDIYQSLVRNKETLEDYLKEIGNYLNRNSFKGKKECASIVTGNLNVGPDDGVTVVQSSQGFFPLKPPAVINFTEQNTNPPEIIIRCYIKEVDLLRFSIEDIGPKIVRRMVDALEDVVGFKSDVANFGIYGTFEFPGTNGVFIRKPECAGRIEIRLYSSCIKIEE